MARLIIGNWKMNGDLAFARELAKRVAAGLPTLPAGVGVGLAPPFPFLAAVGEAIAGSAVELVAQDCHEAESGAFTGDVAVPMLAAVGVKRVIVGHSERRHGLGEDDARVRAKLDAVLKAGLDPVLCVGETLQERDAEQHEAVVKRQLEAGLGGLGDAEKARVSVAYEPVWAIGTGRTATPEQASAMHVFIRSEIGDGAGPILYGGSVKPGNIEGLAQAPAIEGALVGGASLKAESFLAIVAGVAATVG